MMRFRGGGVGHKSTREASNFFKKDRDRLDMPGLTEPDKQVDAEMEGDFEELADEVDHHHDEDEEEDFGYVREESDVSEGELAAEDEDVDFGPEDDGVLDPDQDMGELGYGDL
jgi:hypothetical protein